LINLYPSISYKSKRAALILLIVIPFFASSQPKKTGSIEYLKYSNGFGDIALGADLNQLPGYKLAFLDNDNKFDADSCLKFEYRDANLLRLPGDLKLDLIGLRTYKNKVVNIYLFFKLSDGYKILRVLLNNYGLFTNKPNDYADIYNWDSSTTSLSLRYNVKIDLGVAVFTCNRLENEIESMKTKQYLSFLRAF
jgi:hypothetical protein